MVVKRDYIHKHAGKKKVLMVNGSWIQNVCMLKMRFLIVQLSITIVLQQLNSGQAMEDKWKFVQFANIFNLLNKGKPMINYEDFQPLYEFLKFRSNPKNLKHLSSGASWEITKYIQNEVLKAIKLVVQNSNFVFYTYDEVIPIDNASWANVHGYIVQDWCRIPLLGSFMVGVHKSNVLPQNHLQDSTLNDHYIYQIIYLVDFSFSLDLHLLFMVVIFCDLDD